MKAYAFFLLVSLKLESTALVNSIIFVSEPAVVSISPFFIKLAAAVFKGSGG